MSKRLRVDAEQSRFTVQAFATGVLSFLGHNPTFGVREFSGHIAFDSDSVSSMRLSLIVNAASLQLLDDVQPADRAEIECRMQADVLDVASFPEIRFESGGASTTPIEKGRHPVEIDGRLTLHGVGRPHCINAELVFTEDGVRIRGETTLRMSDFEIKPVSALGGTIRLRDELKLRFDIAAHLEGP